MSSGVGTPGRVLVVLLLSALTGASLTVAVRQGWHGAATSQAAGPAAAGEGAPDVPVVAGLVQTLALTPTPEVDTSSADPTSVPIITTTVPVTSSTSPTTVPVGDLTWADRAAGVRSLQVPDRGTGVLGTVSGRTAAPAGSGPVHVVRVRVEGGLGIDDGRFATFVLAVLNDPRSWGAGGRMRFSRTASATADVDVVLASPRLSEQLCRPLDTGGTQSCRNGRTVVLTAYRWVLAIPDYGWDRSGYRRYVVNHEMGHWLGHGHRTCPGSGRRAPVMMQQTLGLRGCRPNPWPYPDAGL